MAGKFPYQKKQIMESKDMMHQEPYYEDEISLKELFLVLYRGKKNIALVTAVIFLITMIGAIAVPQIHIGTKGTVQTAVKLYFSGIELGQTPTGAEYDVNEIKSTDILKKALESNDFGSKQVNLELLKQNITLEAVVPDSVAKTLKELEDVKDDEIRMETLESLNGYSNVYIVKLNLADDLGLDLEGGRILLDSIIHVYKAQLIDTYGDDTILADVFADSFHLDLEDYDYIQAANILNDQLTRMESFVTFHLPDTDSTSTVTGVNPADISSALSSLRTVDMEGILTRIGAFYLTKSPAKVVALYEQMAEDKEKESAKYKEEAAAIRIALLGYKKNDQTIVLGNAGQEQITLTSENDDYNQLVNQYVEAGVKSANASEDAAYYRGEALRFQSTVPQNSVNSTQAKQVTEDMALLKDKLVYWTGIINDTSQDYLDQSTYQQFAEQLMPAKSYNDLETGPSLQKIAAVGLMLGLVIGVMAVLFQAYMKEDILAIKEENEDENK